MAEAAAGDALRSHRNTARFFVENRPIAWVLLAAVVAWGAYGYLSMPKRKDPEIPVRVASAVTPWPGTAAEQIEELVTKPVEDTAAQNLRIHPAGPTAFGIKSLTLPGVSIVQIQLAESVADPEKEFSDINLRLNALNASLPQGAGPIQFNSGFGETAALLLTVASPKETAVEVAVRARDLAAAIRAARAGVAGARATVVVALPRTVDATIAARGLRLLAGFLEGERAASDPRAVEGSGFVALDVATALDDAALLERVHEFLRTGVGIQRFHPDAWEPAIVRDPAGAEARLMAVRGDRYSYRELDTFSELLARGLLTVPQVSAVQRSGVQQEQVFLAYSQERLAAYGIAPSSIKQLLNARNTPIPGGVIQADRSNVLVTVSGEFASEREIGGVIVARAPGGVPVYMRDLFEVYRGYQSPPRFLNFHTWRDAAGDWQRSRAVSLAVQMRAGEQIAAFGAGVDAVLEDLRVRLPQDLVLARTSDQPQQVRENLELFMTALYEAILLVVAIAFIGFREWRSAALMMVAIPITLAMTFGMLKTLGVDLQQVSVATLIIALGLLVDDPVVAGDAIKRELAAGEPPLVAAWLGPTRLASAILFATITNVVAYLPLLLLTGNQGDFLHSLPIVMACALIASRIVSMTFIPLLGFYLLRPETRPQPAIEARRTRGFTGWYFRVGSAAIEHRWKVLAAALALLALGVYFKHQLKDAFFPDDVQYLFYVDLWTRNDASLAATDAAAAAAAQVIRETAEAHGAAHPGRDGRPRQVLESITTFSGGGAPRFWFAVTPELQQQNYAQLVVRVADKHDTPRLVGPLQAALSARVPGATIDVRQLQTNPVPYPVELRLSGRVGATVAERDRDVATLRALAAELREILRGAPLAARVRDDWGEQTFVARLRVDADRANLAGVTNQDVAASSAAALNGYQVATLRAEDKQIPVLLRMRPHERATLSDLGNLYVFAAEDSARVPLREVAAVDYAMRTERLRRLDHFRTVSVIAFPAPGALASEVMASVRPQLDAFAERLPPGYRLAVAGEEAKTREGFGQLVEVLRISVALIFIALVFQFRSAVKPLIVFAAVPFGVVGALAALYFMGSPFGFMGFLGIVSLVGVIVSHVIVLFDFIEEMHARGEPLREALLDAGIIRLRPVLITVGATVTALVPLALHGGPLWAPLCYAQIGGLLVATFVTLLLVPVIYSICVLDLKIVHWDGPHAAASSIDSRSAV
jgi:multidrug efflux pump subunit AcrB